MKRLLILWCICLQAFVSSATAAWSPLDVYHAVFESEAQCLTLVQNNEQNESKNNEGEEEEEPDCD